MVRCKKSVLCECFTPKSISYGAVLGFESRTRVGVNYYIDLRGIGGKEIMLFLTSSLDKLHEENR